MANIKYYSGETELTRVWAKQGVGLVGQPVGFEPTYDRDAQKWIRPEIKVERKISYKSNPSRHECDARCINATGRTMQCECSCGGVNHGRGAFQCAAS